LEDPVDITLESPDGFTFVGSIKIRPNKILEMNVSFATTENPETTSVPMPTSGNEEVEFKKLYNNVSSNIRNMQGFSCGVDHIEKEEINRGFTDRTPDELWADGEVPWAFVSNGDDFATHAIHTDEIVGLTKGDVETIEAAMRQIEDGTCIRFRKIKPVKGQPWLFISRDSKASDKTCQRKYIQDNLVGKNIEDLGDIYRRFGPDWLEPNECFEGAYAWYGVDSPQNFAISQMESLSSDNQNTIGLVIHELLHNLGLGHTQKRQDASEYIEINWNNIDPTWQYAYQGCVAGEDPRCSRYNHYDTEYDCMSIMHYRDYFFITDQALEEQKKTMTPKKPGCDLSSPNSILRNSDIAILNQMYCKDHPQSNVIESPNYPSNYPDNIDNEYPISVEEGHYIELSFTKFDVEEETSCSFDWVTVEDGDGRILLDKTCGTTIPQKVVSHTNSLTVKFHSDHKGNKGGFHAEYKEVEAVPTPINGNWGEWSGLSKCSNGRDGKSVCKQKNVRYCNNPPASNGGLPCVGDSEFTLSCLPHSINPEDNLDCVLDGEWSAWSNYSTCSVSCQYTRARLCNDPMPVNGKECEGDGIEISTCNGGKCPNISSGLIKSTNYPNIYPVNDDVTFPLEVEAGSTIQLTFSDFDLEVEPMGCIFDYVKVLDSDGSTELAKLCGASLPAPINSSGNKLTVIFHSDHSVNHQGFLASWKKVHGDSFGEITSPNFPNSYPNNIHDGKTISVPQGSKIELLITDLNIESTGNAERPECPYDKLTVYDGSVEHDNIIAELCGPSVESLSVNPIRSEGNTMNLVFKSDGSVIFTGFRATWKQI